MRRLLILQEYRLERGVGFALTVAAHVLVVMGLLSGRSLVSVETPAITARLISEAPDQTPVRDMLKTKLAFSTPKTQITLPDITVEQAEPKEQVTTQADLRPAAAQARVVDSEADIVEPRFDADYLKNPAPTYPRASRRLREQGMVVLRVLVSSQGAPEIVELHTSSGYTLLDTSALETVRRWKFVPAQLAGHAVEAWVIVPIEFSLTT
jgi:periplasmic protein TonB